MRSAVLLVLGGCLQATPGPTTVHWNIVNESPDSIRYSILLEGGAALHRDDGLLQPGQTREHTMMVNGAELTATVRLQGGDEAVLGSFADPSCDQHELDAVWNGTWSLRWHSADC